MRDPDTGQPVPGHAVRAEYAYTDRHGVVIRGVSRCIKKCFRQWRPDPSARSGRRWTTKLDDGSEVGVDLIYRLPEVLAAMVERPFPRNLWVVEGEKDADRLWSLGYPATCNPQGAGKWTDDHAAWLAGADVMIVADRDGPGYRHAEQVANTLLPGARSVEIVRAAAGKDISDHLDAGHRMSHLVTVAAPKPEPTEERR
jgi:DNA primase